MTTRLVNTPNSDHNAIELVTLKSETVLARIATETRDASEVYDTLKAAEGYAKENSWILQ